LHIDIIVLISICYFLKNILFDLDLVFNLYKITFITEGGCGGEKVINRGLERKDFSSRQTRSRNMSEAVLSRKVGNIVFPQFSQWEARVDSFKNANQYSIIYNFKTEFAEAGFFHTGKDDETICYYCGGGLKDWDDADDPWEEHARWFGRCLYLLLFKGQQFVDEHMNKKTCSPIMMEIPDEASKQDKVEDKDYQVTVVKEVERFRECVVCLSSQRSIVFLPCRHFCTCTSCALKVDNCVYCRNPIVSMMKIFLV
jgi:baculoviral IAP repeat-containing protein 7/8